MLFKVAIFGTFLLAAVQWLTGDGSAYSRNRTWALFGMGIVLAAIYVVIFLGKRV